MTAVPFHLSLDPHAKAAYLRFTEAVVDETIELAPGMYLDVDHLGGLIGIEILSAGNVALLLDGFPSIRDDLPTIPEMDPVQLGELQRFFERTTA